MKNTNTKEKQIWEKKRAPAFCLPNQDGKKICLRDIVAGLAENEYALLYFYPRDNTPGCTTEAIAFTALQRKLKNAGVQVWGISKLTPQSKQKFIAKHNLKIPLLSDEDCTISTKYGVYKEKNMYGKKVWGIARDSFLIDFRGKIIKHWQKVKPQEHPDEVLAFAKTL